MPPPLTNRVKSNCVLTCNSAHCSPPCWRRERVSGVKYCVYLPIKLRPSSFVPWAAAWKTELQTFNLTNLHENVRFSMVCFGDNDIGILHCKHRESWFSAHFIFAALLQLHIGILLLKPRQIFFHCALIFHPPLTWDRD